MSSPDDHARICVNKLICIPAMADRKGPEPKPIAIWVMALAGSLGGIAQTIVLALFRGSTYLHHYFVVGYALVGAFVGAAIGLGIALSPRLWIRLAASAVLGSTALIVSAFLLGEGPRQGSFWPADRIPGYITLHRMVRGALPALLLTAGHDFFLRYRNQRAAAVKALGPYLVLGALSDVLGISGGIVTGHEGAPEFAALEIRWLPFGLTGIAMGSVFGIIQFLGLLAALGVDRRIRPRLAPPPGSVSRVM